MPLWDLSTFDGEGQPVRRLEGVPADPMGRTEGERVLYSSGAERQSFALRIDASEAENQSRVPVVVGGFLAEGRLLPTDAAAGSWFHARLLYYNSTDLVYEDGLWNVAGGQVLFAVGESRWAGPMMGATSDQDKSLAWNKVVLVGSFQAPPRADGFALAVHFGNADGNDINMSFQKGVDLLREAPGARPATVLGISVTACLAYAFQNPGTVTSRVPEGSQWVEVGDASTLVIPESRTRVDRRITIAFGCGGEPGWSELSFDYVDNDVGEWGFNLTIDGQPRNHADRINAGNQSIDPRYFFARPLGFAAQGTIWLDLVLSQSYPPVANLTQDTDYELDFYSIETGLDLGKMTGLAITEREHFQ